MGLAADVLGNLVPALLALAIAWPTDLLPYAAISFGINWAAAILYAIPFQSEKFYDLTGSFTFVTVAVVAATVHPMDWQHRWRAYICSILVVLWTARLGIFLFRRIRAAGTDSRFDSVRTKPLAFLTYWSIQGLWVFITILPVLYVNVKSKASTSTTLLASDVIGWSLWALGITVEAIADAQKSAFRTHHPGTFISTGLWAYSRHPNYFGEIVLWVGMTIVCAPPLDSVWHLQLLSCLSPLLVATLLIFVSGIPMLEAASDKKFGHLEAYQVYKRDTSVLVPWCRKSKASLPMTGPDYGSAPA
ncbi:Aste57867_21669 [Aphanomyces stellatus]|uniref:Aste57867_21669 protein n=1 Tax=Aphanomyces stellatus TaxID=120398 RepID=A0A485LIU0_9STRA|nr:hypothetical protein As57867_021600 [Aphanomyces stellatus]VFT98338.1 Aste57867_21669 [Aphanomyces stellatus]